MIMEDELLMIVYGKDWDCGSKAFVFACDLRNERERERERERDYIHQFWRLRETHSSSGFSGQEARRIEPDKSWIPTGFDSVSLQQTWASCLWVSEAVILVWTFSREPNREWKINYQINVYRNIWIHTMKEEFGLVFLLGHRALSGLPSPVLVGGILSAISHAGDLFCKELAFIFFVEWVGDVVIDPVSIEDIAILRW